jgi:hypothetical protein
MSIAAISLDCMEQWIFLCDYDYGSICHVLVKLRRPVISLVALVATMKKINRGYPNENMVVQLFSVPIR